jgi:serine/threonine-protein kinase
VKIPDLLSLSAEQAVSVAPDIFEYEITYRRNPDKKSGCVISQTPLPDVTRRLYGSSNKIKIKLSVNTPENTLTLPDLSGTSLRDALILLKSVGANVNIREEYSNTVGYGKIISSSLPKGTLVKDGDVITLSASLGKETLYVSVPDLSGLNENQALALLRSKNLEIGEIKYQSSKMPIGTVISQSIANGTSLPEKSKISFTVSGGIYY